MVDIKNLTATKIAVGVLALAMTVGVLFTLAPRVQAAALTEAQIQNIINLIQGFGADAATIANVNASLHGNAPTTPTTPSTSSACPYKWNTNLKIGSTGTDVMKLQQFLNSMSGTVIATSGAGSAGMESTYYGAKTGAAVKKFQEMYKGEILTPVGLTSGTTNFFSSTRAKANALCVGGSTGGTTTPPVTGTGTGLMVSSASQPMNSSVLNGAARIPFTKFTVTAGNDGDVVVNSVTVKRVGLGSNAAFDGIVLLDEAGMQVGISKTLNSNDQANVGENVTIPRGTSKTFTVAGNMISSLSAYQGEQLALSVVGVNTSATVTGSLPIMGATHNVNSTLVIGTLTVQRGAQDPSTDQTKEVGVTGYNFSSVKVTAGSAENVWVKSIRWNQVGSAAAGDLKNVKTTVDGVDYDTVVSSDGKYFTTSFAGNGVKIDKGVSKDFTVKADIAGGSGRTVAFDIAKKTDIYAVGETYGYGLTPPAGSSNCASDANDSSFCTGEDPWYNGSEVTVNTGSLIVSTWPTVNAQNLAENVLNQPIAGFSVEARGEPVTVGSIKIYLTETGSAADRADLTNLTLVDQNGSVVAGPVDGSASNAYVTFSDSITFPTGVTNLTLKGKLGTDFANNDTVSASTTPTDWSNVKGDTTGKTITPSPASTLTGPTMTMKAGSVNVSVSSVPTAQTVIAGAQGFLFANYIIDATGSGEDVRVTSIPLAYGGANTAVATSLTACQLYDGSTSVTSGSNSKNPSSFSSSTQFTFDGSGLMVTKGTSKTLALKCNVSTGATGSYLWGIDDAQNSSLTSFSGVTSGTTIVETFTDSNGQTMSIGTSGTLTAVLDTNSPGYKIVSAGSTGVELARIKFSASNEDIDLKQIALQLSSVASNTPTDLVGRQVTLWTTAGVQVGTVVFPAGDNGTSSAISNFRIPKDGSNVLVVKGDIAGISNSGPLTSSGDLLVVDYDGSNSGLNGTYGTGVASGSTATPASGDTASNGVRIMKAYPVLAQVALSGSNLTLVSGGDKVLYRFKVTATDGDVALYKFSFNIGSSTVSATTSALAAYVYTDSSFSTADTTFSSDGKLNVQTAPVQTLAGTNSIDVNMLFQKASGGNTTYIVPAGATRYFELRATVANVETGTGSESISVKLLGDAAYPVNAATLMDTATGVDGDTNDDFIWSPISTTTQNTINDLDFTNGYQVQGLPSVNMTSETLTSTN